MGGGTVFVQDRPGATSPVLLIEGDSEAAEALRKALAVDRHPAELACSGEAGIEKAREFRPEVVLCDLDLPGVGGCAVARSLFAEPALGEPILVALASGAAADAGRCREAGFDFCLAKPADLLELESLIRPRPRQASTSAPRSDSPPPTAAAGSFVQPSAIAGYSRPDTVHCGPFGIYLLMTFALAGSDLLWRMITRSVCSPAP